MEKSSQVVNVAVAIIVNAERQVLLARRAAHVHQGGLLEFPGGKVESGETAEAALKRECWEEVGIKVERCHLFCEVVHHYHDKSVKLITFMVDRFSGAPHGKEGQPVFWEKQSLLNVEDFPEANKVIVLKLATASKSKRDGL